MKNGNNVPVSRSWYQSWPKHMPKHLEYPQVPLFENLKVSAERYPRKDAMIYYGARISYNDLWKDALNFAGYLKQAGLKKGDRVAIYSPNTPHYAIAFYGILRANGVVVTLDPMLSKDELIYLINDSGSKILIAMGYSLPLINGIKSQTCLETVISGAFVDYLPENLELPVNDFILAENECDDATVNWSSIFEQRFQPPEVEVDCNSNALLLYTSGTTGKRKAALHTHKALMATTLRSSSWLHYSSASVHLMALPFFHVTGLNTIFTASIFTGGTIVIMTRWERETAIQAVEKYRCTHWINITAMVVDMLSVPEIKQRDLSSFMVFGGGGAPLPESVGKKLKGMGIEYAEGYGLSEAGAATHMNPIDNPKLQCAGLPGPDVDTLIVDPQTMEILPQGEQGELILRTPSMFKGYWQNPEATEESFLELDGQKWLRTGDLGYMDQDGFFFIVDRLKRMVNRAGLKVWPTAVEGVMYKHPAIKEACVIGVPDERVGEEVGAVIVLNENQKEEVSEKDIIAWSKDNLAAYEYPRVIKFVDTLPKTATGKILWRELQEQAKAKRA